jgi:hypothetical protein
MIRFEAGYDSAPNDVKRAVGVAKRLAMPADYTLCDDTALVMMDSATEGFQVALTLRKPGPDSEYEAFRKTPIVIMSANCVIIIQPRNQGRHDGKDYCR